MDACPAAQAGAGTGALEGVGDGSSAGAGNGSSAGEGTGARAEAKAGAGTGSRTVEPPLLKFCGLRLAGDCQAAWRLGADLAGFIFHPGSPRRVSPAEAAAADTGGLVRVGVFVAQGASEILEIMDEAALDLAQFHGRQTLKDAAQIGPERVVRVFWPERHAEDGSLDRELAEWRDAARMFLFDAGGSGGGHGRSLAGGLDFLARAGKPSLLAGGLGPAILAKLPDLAASAMLAGFDLNSGVESSPGVKDYGLMAAATAAAKALRVCGREGLDREALRTRSPAGQGPGGP
jgi:phosphoribosylanthranilate isomerase